MIQTSPLYELFERAVGEIRSRVSLSAPAARMDRIAIAFSGGLDSAVLLDLACTFAQRNGMSLHAFHVHHGLSVNADAWLVHCQAKAGEKGIRFDHRKIQLGDTAQSGIEEAARTLRYAALGQMCKEHEVDLLLTAHHLDDQAETVLLQLLRGSGVAGLSGMDHVNQAPDLLGNVSLWMARPLLDVARNEIETYAVQHDVKHVEDESNEDPRYARNALRHHVMPRIAQDFPRFQQRFARTAQHAQSAQRLLIELAEQDLSACLEGDAIQVSRLRAFSRDRVDNMLRYWFGVRGVRMPSTAWLDEMRTQLFEAKDDAQLCVVHADCEIHRYRDRVYMTRRIDADELCVAPHRFRWNGESSLHFPAFGGTLHIEAAEKGRPGMDRAWLAAQSLVIALRSGGERLKLGQDRSTRSLKAHYQACDVPGWERPRLPLVFSNEQLLFAAGIGMDCHAFHESNESPLVFRWLFDQ